VTFDLQQAYIIFGFLFLLTSAHAPHGGRATVTYDDDHQLSVISINVFVKPLLDALGEQNRNLQVI
jgi:hypothetical protein